MSGPNPKAESTEIRKRAEAGNSVWICREWGWRGGAAPFDRGQSEVRIAIELAVPQVWELILVPK